MVNKFGIGTGNNVTNQRKRGETTNSNFVGSWQVRRFVTPCRGFSLLELLVSIAIFATITIAVVINYRTGERASELRIASEGVASTLRLLQTMAHTGERRELCGELSGFRVCADNASLCGIGDECRSRLPRGGYGLAVDGSTITVFADGNANYAFDSGEALTDIRVDLPSNVLIEPAQTNLTAAVFEPPDPAVWLNGAQTMTEARVVVQHHVTGETRRILIRRASGRIDVE